MTESNETKVNESNQTSNKLIKKRSLILKTNEPDLKIYPIYLKSKVIKGFGRGSSELNCPTANLKEEVLINQSKLLNQNGIYFGFCKLINDDYKDQIFKMVMSIGFNPVYGNEFKTIEVHVMFEFNHDFYDEEMKVLVLGYIRPEYDYTSKDALIADIEIDKQFAKNTLNQDGFAKYANDKFFE